MEFYQERQREWPQLYRKLAPMLSFFRGAKRILELGSGQGDFLYLAGQAGLKAEGIDLSADIVKACRSRGLKIEQGDALKAVAALKPGAVDAIYSSNVVEHLQASELLALLDAICKKLGRGGKLGIHTANAKCVGILSDSFWHDITHVRPYPPELLRELLEARGFDVLAAEPDELTRESSLIRRTVRVLRTVLIGPYFGPPEIKVLAVKR